MNRIIRHIGAVIAITGVVFFMLAAAIYAAGGRVNTTKSIPVGLYWVASAPIETGSYVIFCPPKAGVFDDAKARGYIGAGPCPGGYGYMMKRVLAAKDDLVSVTDEGVHVNGDLLPLSAPRDVDGAGRKMPRYHVLEYTLGASELLLMSDVSATSFDGRYYGPITRDHVKAVIRPVITW